MNEIAVIDQDKEIELLTAINLYGQFAKNHIINSPESYIRADRKIIEGEHLKKEIKARLDPIVSMRHKAHKEATKFRGGMLDPIESFSKTLVEGMKIYQKQQDEKMAEEKIRLEAEAKRRQEIECLKQAEEMEKAGDSQEAIDAVLELAEDPAPEVHLATPILRSKTSFSPSWDVEVINEDEVPDQYIIKTVNIKAIKQIVKDKKGNIKIPGIKIIETTSSRRNSR